MLKPILTFLLFIPVTSSFAQKDIQIEMVSIPGGTFRMGCTHEQDACKDNEKPAHTVILNDFAISKYEITNAQFCHFLNDIEANPGGSYYGFEYIDIGDEQCGIVYREKQFRVKKNRARHPVVEITWYGAKAFCHWAGGRLPSEAEWEYAAKGGQNGQSFIFSGTDTLQKAGWFSGNYYTSVTSSKFTYREGTLEVGQKLPNQKGMYDMSGNVWEFCNDWFTEDYYKESPRRNPQGPSYSNYRVIRGGSFKEDAGKCRVSVRQGSLPAYTKEDIGFRLCTDPM